MRISIIKKIDRLLGPLAIFFFNSFPDARKCSSAELLRYLIIRPGGIGDAVLLIPAIIALKKRYPGAVIDVIAEKRNSSIFFLCPGINSVFHYDKPSELLSAIRGKYDVIIDTEQWHRLSAVVARLTRAPMSIGYATNERKKVFTHPVRYSHDDNELDSFFHLLEPLSVPMSIDPEKPFLAVPSESTSKIRSLLNAIADKKIVALFPGGSIQERRWGSDRFHSTAQSIVEHGYSVVVVGGREDREAGCEIAAGLESVKNFCGALSLVETAAVLKESALLITGDSGIMHLGFGLGIKTLSLFGPGIEKKWAPRGPGHVVINKNLACSPCTKFGYTPKCKKNAECMKLITVDEVVQKALELLEG